MSRPEPRTCAGCGAEVKWAKNNNTGKSAPVNVTPDPNGNVYLWEDGATYQVLTSAERQEPTDQPRYTLHFATCPKASRFRRCNKCHKGPCACKRTLAGA